MNKAVTTAAPVIGDLAERYGLSPGKLALIKATIAKGATNDELELFLYRASRLGLDPFIGQVWGIKRRSKNPDTGEWETVFSTQTGIDGFRLMAVRTGEVRATYGPHWCGRDGQWRDVWLEDEPPAAARFGVLRQGWSEPLWATAKYTSYVQRDRDAKPTRFWREMPDVMLGNAAERLAYRRGFPSETAGVDVDEVTPEVAHERLAATEIEFHRDTRALPAPTHVPNRNTFPPVPGWPPKMDVPTSEIVDTATGEIVESPNAETSDSPGASPETPRGSGKAVAFIDWYQSKVREVTELGQPDIPALQFGKRIGAVRDVALAVEGMDTALLDKAIGLLTDKPRLNMLTSVELVVLETVVKQGKTAALLAVAKGE